MPFDEIIHGFSFKGIIDRIIDIANAAKATFIHIDDRRIIALLEFLWLYFFVALAVALDHPEMHERLIGKVLFEIAPRAALYLFSKTFNGAD